MESPRPQPVTAIAVDQSEPDDRVHNGTGRAVPPTSKPFGPSAVDEAEPYGWVILIYFLKKKIKIKLKISKKMNLK